MSFFPLFRPFIINELTSRSTIYSTPYEINVEAQHTADVVRERRDKTYGHSSLSELLLGVSTSSVGNVDGVSDLEKDGE
jgi:hypothetical protein